MKYVFKTNFTCIVLFQFDSVLVLYSSWIEEFHHFYLSLKFKMLKWIQIMS